MLDRKIKDPALYPDPVFALGRHITVEYYECAPHVLVQKDRVELVLLKAAKESGASIVSSSFHQFAPQGVSGVIIIAESHFTVHAWPEHNYAAVDIFTCGDNIDLDRAIHSMQNGFSSKSAWISSDQNRGVFNRENRAYRPFCGETVMDRKTLPVTWKKAYEDNSPWGISTSVDLYGCRIEMVERKEGIESFVASLCEQIEIKALQQSPCIHFDQDDSVLGFTTAHAIETAIISGHFVYQSNCAYLDIVACTFYDPRKIAEFALSFLQGDHYKMQVTLRQ